MRLARPSRARRRLGWVTRCGWGNRRDARDESRARALAVWFWFDLLLAGGRGSGWVGLGWDACLPGSGSAGFGHGTPVSRDSLVRVTFPSSVHRGFSHRLVRFLRPPKPTARPVSVRRPLVPRWDGSRPLRSQMLPPLPRARAASFRRAGTGGSGFYSWGCELGAWMDGWMDRRRW
jgi:hypothetical protein